MRAASENLYDRAEAQGAKNGVWHMIEFSFTDHISHKIKIKSSMFISSLGINLGSFVCSFTMTLM